MCIIRSCVKQIWDFLKFHFYTVKLHFMLKSKSPGASAVFGTTLFEAVFAASISVFVAVSINFLTYHQIF